MNNRLRYFLTPLIFISFLCAAMSVTYSQQQTAGKPMGSISGRLSSSQKPVSGIVVQLFGPPRPGQPGRPVVAEVVTDDNGNYNFRSLAPATYDVVPVTSGYAISDRTQFYGPGRSVAVGPGENVSEIDFDLLRSGTIKGKIRDANGNPVASEWTTVVTAEKDPAGSLFGEPGIKVRPSDAQGNYTIDNVPPGRYFLSNTNPTRLSGRWRANNRPLYNLTYYPGTRDPRSATVIEVAPGAKLTGMDITLGSPVKTYQITGRVIDDRSGDPIAKVGFSMTFAAPDGSGITGGAKVSKSDSTGQFTIPDVLPGHFIIRPEANVADNIYGDRIEFDLIDKDVTELEVKMHRGASISGKIVVEGASAASDLEKFLKLEHFLLLQPPGWLPSWLMRGTIDADGNFQFAGVRPGLAKLTLHSTIPSTEREFSILKIKRDDQNLPDLIELASGDDLSGLQIIVKAAAVAPGIIRGEVKVESGDLDDVRMAVMCYPIGVPANATAVMLDSRNHFVIEKLQPGEYELLIGPRYSSASNENGGKTINRMPTVKQTVRITNSTETEVTLTMKLNPR